ncbi:hypothetical protein MTO96_012504 [Rhipicephalus appendiculatus]
MDDDHTVSMEDRGGGKGTAAEQSVAELTAQAARSSPTAPGASSSTRKEKSRKKDARKRAESIDVTRESGKSPDNGADSPGRSKKHKREPKAKEQ